MGSFDWGEHNLFHFVDRNNVGDVSNFRISPTIISPMRQYRKEFTGFQLIENCLNTLKS